MRSFTVFEQPTNSWVGHERWFRRLDLCTVDECQWLPTCSGLIIRADKKKENDDNYGSNMAGTGKGTLRRRTWTQDDMTEWPSKVLGTGLWIVVVISVRNIRTLAWLSSVPPGGGQPLYIWHYITPQTDTVNLRTGWCSCNALDL
jgi:hypothetical protein